MGRPHIRSQECSLEPPAAGGAQISSGAVPQADTVSEELCTYHRTSCAEEPLQISYASTLRARPTYVAGSAHLAVHRLRPADGNRTVRAPQCVSSSESGCGDQTASRTKPRAHRRQALAVRGDICHTTDTLTGGEVDEDGDVRQLDNAEDIWSMRKRRRVCS